MTQGLLATALLALFTTQQFFVVAAFTTISPPWGTVDRSTYDRHQQQTQQTTTTTTLYANSSPNFRPIPTEEEGIPIPFVDVDGQNFLECYADSIAEVDGVEYTIGVPCDYAVALCYFREDEQLVPLELNDPKMDEIFPMAESIVEEEFGDELVLQRTPQTLTLVGELEADDDDEEEDIGLDDEDDDGDGDEEVEVLLAFEQDGRQYNLVRMLDPMLLVGKTNKDQPGSRVLLTPEESDKVMPVLEDLFLEFREDVDDVLP